MKELSVPTVRRILDTSAEKYGDRPFIKYFTNGRSFEKSFNDLRKDSLSVCRFLKNKTDEKINVAVIGKTSYEYLVFAMGVLISGNVFIPFAPEISSAEAASLFDSADISMLLCSDDFGETAREICVLCPRITETVVFSSLFNIKNEFSDSSEYAALSDCDTDVNDVAMIVFTSGTTGIRKGVMLSQKGLVGNVMYTDYVDVLREGETTLSVLPMYHVYCFSGDFIRNLMNGVTFCLNTEMRDLQANLLRYQPGVMRVVPMIASSLLQRVKVIRRREPALSAREAAERVFGKNIHFLISGGAYLPPELIEDYAECGITLRQGYGMTEAGCRISVPDTEADKSSVGRVIDICDVRTQNGEIQVNTPSVMLGYYKMPEETKASFTEDGWLKTGDIGYVTEDGQLFITGRAKNLIILSGGENVSPEAIEKKFNSYPFVQEVMAYAEKDRIILEVYPDFGEIEAAGIDDYEAEIKGRVSELNKTAKPSHIIAEVRFRAAPFEKTGTGKIKRKENTI